VKDLFKSRPDRKNQNGVRPGRGIAFRLSLWILLSATVIFTLVFGYYYFLTRQIMIRKIGQHAVDVAQGTAARLDVVLAAAQKIPQNVSVLISNPAYADHQKLVDLMTSVLKNNADVYGMAIAFEPYSRDRRKRLYSPYAYRKADGIADTLITYDYFSWDWYRLPALRSRALWVEPYFDEGAGDIIMSTYSVPVYRDVSGRNTFSGVVTVDISLEWLRRIVAEIQLNGRGYAFLVSQSGMFVTHPDQGLIMNQTIFDLAQEAGDPALRRVGLRMTTGESGMEELKGFRNGEPCWLAFAPLSTTGWSLGLVLPRDELMTDVSRHYHLTLLFGTVGMILLFGVVLWVARGMTRPLRVLTAATQTMAAGNLEVPIPAVRRQDEIGRLAASFAAMRQSLQTYIRELTRTTAAKERIESELRIAHDIQMGMLPRIFPPFPDRADMDIYALLQPAREVGGDLYDFFFMDENHLCFIVGDVSGKGVPAALLMAVTKILVKSKALRGVSPSEILRGVNDDLAQDNPSMMFVTMFLGILDVRTGETVYANAGHPSPCVIRSGAGIETLPFTGGMALGVVEGFSYRTQTVKLQKNDALFLYSDGVTEASNDRNELFESMGLNTVVGDLKTGDPKALIDGMLSRIEAFAGDEPQADDITMLGIRYYGTER